VDEVVVCSAPDGSGDISESVLAACAVAGVTEVYPLGGAQAIAALAYGTETVRPVEKVVGSGGRFVRCAQRLVRGWVGTGPEAGPSELVVIADRDASPGPIAADLIVNAARGPRGTHAVISDAPDLLTEVIAALDVAVDAHDPSGDIENALIEGGRAIVVRDLDQAVAIANAFAPQFLMLSIADPEAVLSKVRNAGVVLVGGDTLARGSLFYSGTGGVAPSNGTARWDSSLTPRDFIKTIEIAGADPEEADKLAPLLQVLIETEPVLAANRDPGLRSRP
jgi:histidinol dehydrogenase